MKSLPLALLVGALCTTFASSASAVRLDNYYESTSDMLFKMDWRVHDAVQENLKERNVEHANPQIQTCYRAGNVESEIRKIFSEDDHESKRSTMNGITTAVYESLKTPKVGEEFFAGVPVRDDNDTEFERFMIAAQNNTSYNSITADQMKDSKKWITGPDYLGDVDLLEQRSLRKHFGYDADSTDHGEDGLLALAIGAHNELDGVVGLAEGYAENTASPEISAEGINPAFDAAASAGSAFVTVKQSNRVFRYPVKSKLRNHGFNSCVSGSAWDQASQYQAHWPQRWCHQKYKDVHTYLGAPLHSFNTPLCDCIERNTVAIPGTEYTGISTSPSFGFAVASITKSEHARDWQLSYKLYSTNPSASFAMARTADESMTSRLPLTPSAADGRVLEGTVSLRDFLANPPHTFFAESNFSGDNPGQMKLIAGTMGGETGETYILEFKVEPVADKAERVYCGMKRLGTDNQVDMNRAIHAATTEVTDDIGSSVTSWVVSADDENREVTLGNQTTLLLGGREIHTGGTGSELVYNLKDPSIPASGSLMDFNSVMKVEIDFPEIPMGMVNVDPAAEFHVTRDEGVEIRSSGNFGRFSTGHEDWMVATGRNGGSLKGSGAIGPVQVGLEGNLTVGVKASVESETTITSLQEKRMEQNSHTERVFDGWAGWGWFRWPRYRNVTVLDDVVGTEDNGPHYETIVAQTNTQNHADALTTFDLDLTMELWPFLDLEISLMNNVYVIPLSDNYAHGSLMLTNEQRYAHASGNQDGAGFSDPMPTYDGIACIEGDENDVSSLITAYASDGSLSQEGMTESEMLSCDDVDFPTWKPDPTDPSDPGQLIPGMTTTIITIYNKYNLDIYCTKYEQDLLQNLDVPQDLIFQPLGDNSQYCVVVLVDDEGNHVFPTNAARDQYDSECYLKTAEDCEDGGQCILEERIVGDDGEVVMHCGKA